MKTQIMTATEAINQSICQNEIVHIADHTTVQHELTAACDDWVNAGEDQDGETILEFWGTQNGDEWRVHLHI